MTDLAVVSTNGGGLPEPAGRRWQPLRLGLLNLYRFDHEEFRFADGRLLLRGNNGTGKSRVLALTLPFLLDGEVAAHRLEPDGDPAKRIEWNLLLGTHDDRLGYSWIEFGRDVPTEDAGNGDGRRRGRRYLTIGCGMRAVRGRGLAQRWFFVTDRRIGVDLHLQAPTGQALTRDRLADALGDRGQIHETATAHRAAVDAELFGLGEHRYGALVDLLIQLRKPQLSRQLDAAELSDALSEALPPLPTSVVGDVAEAFRTLEADRADLASFQAAASATREFLAAYSRYAAVAVRRRVKAVTGANSDYEATQRRLRDAELRHEAARAELDRIEAERRDARQAVARTTEEVTTLAASPAMDRARELERAREDARSAAVAAERAAADRDRAAAEVTDRREQLAAVARRASASAHDVAAAAGSAADAADAAALTDEHQRTLGSLELPDGADADDVETGRRTLSAAVDRRRQALLHLRGLGAAVDAASRELGTVTARLDEVTAQLDGARDAERAAAEAREDALAEVLDHYRRWAGAAVEIDPPTADDVAWELETWQPADDHRSPLARAVDAAVTDARRRLTGAGAALTAERGDLERTRAAVAAQREEVAAAAHLPPPAPVTRDPDGREGRPGAPLWQLVDVRDGLDGTAAAGFEAALQAAGLLDAWITPDGAALDPADHDTALVTSDSSPAPEGGLTRVLTVEIDEREAATAAVDRAVVTAVLERIGATVDAGDTWVTADGRFRIGPLRGTGDKPVAEHLGHAARQQARRRRLAELDAELADLEDRLRLLGDRATRLEARTDVLDHEADTAPTDGPIRSAATTHAAVVRQVAELRERHGRTQQEVADRRQALEDAERALASAASDLDLSAHVDDLPALEQALAAYRETVAALWPTVTAHLAVLAERDRAAAEVVRAERASDRYTERADELARTVAAAAARRDTLQDTVGAAVADVLARLEDAKERRAAAEQRREQLDERRVEAGGDLRAAATDGERLAEALDGDTRRRRTAIDRLAAVVAAGMLPVADPDLVTTAGLDDPRDASGWSPDRAVRTARQMDKVLDDVSADDAAWARVAETIHGHFAELERTLLAHGLRPAATIRDGLFVVTVPFQGEDRGVAALRDLLDDEVANRQALLTHREREILEDHLIGDVAAELHRLLRDGETWVREVNDELDEMPTSTGMKLRFTWRPRDDGPAGLAEARNRMLAHHAGWTPEQRRAVGAFLQQQIERVRETDDAGTWQQHLAAALDYRRWHAFSVERWQDGTWRRLTRRTHGTGSGGEKALALTVPQFAAAAAHYRSAGDHAPRLIMLDEAFVGIDSDMRAKCMGLLEQFDLDVVMTSEREWGCYPTVPALAIVQLATRPGIDAVGVSRWLWNGRERVADGFAPAPATPPGSDRP